jgi:hypothetical protein
MKLELYKKKLIFLFGFPFNKNLSSGNGCFTSKNLCIYWLLCEGKLLAKGYLFQFANNDFKSHCENIIILKVKPNVDDMNLFQCHYPIFGRVW